MKINWFKILVYISIVFLIVALIKGDYLSLPESIILSNLLISLIFLFASFIFLCIRWHIILAENEMRISLRDSFISVGLSIFAKYIPGKLLMVIGKTRYIKQRYPHQDAALLNASFQDQFLAIWTGLMVGSISLVILKNQTIIVVSVIVWCALAFFLYSKKVYSLINSLTLKIFKKDLRLNMISHKKTIKLFGIHILYWLFLGIGFLFLTNSFLGGQGKISHIFIFPLSVSIGVVSIFSPGGIGIRELVLSTYFTNLNLELQDAVSLAALSRLWFLVGEVFIFFLAILFSSIAKIELKKEK